MPDDTGTDNKTTDDNSTNDTDDKTKAPPAGNETESNPEVDKWKSMARKHEKAFKDLSKEFETLKAQSMTDQEKAINEARQTGANEAKQLFGSRLVASEIKVGLAGRIDGESFDKLIGGLNVSSFLTDDGEVNSDAVASFVKAIVPAEVKDEKKSLNLGQGTRTTTTSLADDNGLENALLRAAGVSR